MHGALHVPLDRRLYQVPPRISLMTGLDNHAQTKSRSKGSCRYLYIVHLIMAIVTTCQIADPLWYAPLLHVHPSSVA